MLLRRAADRIPLNRRCKLQWLTNHPRAPSNINLIRGLKCWKLMLVDFWEVLCWFLLVFKEDGAKWADPWGLVEALRHNLLAFYSPSTRGLCIPTNVYINDAISQGDSRIQHQNWKVLNIPPRNFGTNHSVLLTFLLRWSHQSCSVFFLFSYMLPADL